VLSIQAELKLQASYNDVLRREPVAKSVIFAPLKGPRTDPPVDMGFFKSANIRANLR